MVSVFDSTYMVTFSLPTDVSAYLQALRKLFAIFKVILARNYVFGHYRGIPDLK
jgi:hypothetical protein